MVTALLVIGRIDIWVFGILGKSIVLPDLEINRGQEHDDKAMDRDSWNLEEPTQDNATMVYISILPGADENPSSPNVKARDKELPETGQSSGKPNSEKGLKHSEKKRPKDGNNDKESTARSPKPSDRQGDGGLVVGRKRTQLTPKGVQRNLTDATKVEATVPRDKAGLDMQSALTNPQLISEGRGLYRLMLNEELFLAAYHRIKSKPGNMTPGIDKETLDEISLEKIRRIIKSLKDQSFQFKPVRRVLIAKANGKQRPLGIPSPMDKLVQEVMRMILEQLYEPKFSEHSYGFRPGRGCHSALKQIAKWNGVTWAIEGDIKGYFDNVDHNILANLLKKRINDTRFIDLYWKLVRAGYVENGNHHGTTKGVPQGGLLSPLLSNIYLHELDKFMENKIESLSSKGKLISKVNPKMAWFTTRLTRLSKKYSETKDPIVLKELKTLRKERNTLPSRIRQGIRIQYVRYADDWVVGIIGEKEFTENLKTEIAKFLKEELSLDLNLEKTKVTNLGSDRAKFLGVEFHNPNPSEAKMVTRNMGDGRKIVSRVNHVRIYFKAPMKEIYTKLLQAGFCKDEKGTPSAITKWIHLDHRAILLRYNEVARGFMNYYSFVDNYSSIASVVNFTLLHSCAKTLARKFKLDSRASVFAKFGNKLTPQDKLTEIIQTANKKKKPKLIEFVIAQL